MGRGDRQRAGRLVHRDQAALAGRARAAGRGPHGRGLPAARLADLAAEWRLERWTPLTTDRSDASGTGYWSPREERYRPDLLERAFGRVPALPRVLAPHESGAATPAGVRLGPGAGDNAAAALGLGAREGDVIVSIGTSGTVYSVSAVPAAGRVRDGGRVRRRDRAVPAADRDAERGPGPGRGRCPARGGPRGAGRAGPERAGRGRRLVMVPYLEGERTPNKPYATGAVHGLRLATSTPAHLARAAVEGLLCGLADGLDAVLGQGGRLDRIILIGGGARSAAVRRIAPAIFGVPVLVPPAGEYVADGAARQAAWIALGGAEPPQWTASGAERFEADPTPHVREAYARARELVVDRPTDRVLRPRSRAAVDELPGPVRRRRRAVFSWLVRWWGRWPLRSGRPGGVRRPVRPRRAVRRPRPGPRCAAGRVRGPPART